MLRPLKLMLDRATTNGADSDTAYFMELLYVGEMVLKLTTAGFIAGLEEDSERNRYRLLHTLVRANGVGDWSARLDEALSGPASQHLASALSEDRRIFNEAVGKGSWQYEAVKEITEVLAYINPTTPAFPQKAILRTWFTRFAELRNKTRGHGAPTAATCATLAPKLQSSIITVIEESPIFNRSWAYLHRNLSGRYRVISLGGESHDFDILKKSSAEKGPNYPEGIYMYAGEPKIVELVKTDLDVSDFFIANGAFDGKSYELHSLISDEREQGDATPYLAIATERPPSETEGTRDLEVVGNVFSNMPRRPTDYVYRPGLEAGIRSALLNDRHPIVTLVGRGGIGKTSATLNVIHDIATTDRYNMIVWFSARDIDLTVSGPKPVKAKALTEREIAAQYFRYAQSLTSEELDKRTGAELLASHLRANPHGPTMFVFDNFETVRSPIDLFNWLDTHVRGPNKVVITSRLRDFKADFPIDVGGMEPEEAELLIGRTVEKLGISNLIGSKESLEIIEDSDGHPYVIKIILGEAAARGRFEKPAHMMIRKDEILDALFERTYSSLTPMAARLFLTLSGWRSLVPQLAAEAVLLRHALDGGNPATAVDELVRLSLIERLAAEDGNDFLEVPLAAALFGRKKLAVSPHRDLVEGDVRFLQEIGATARTGLKDGLRPRIQALFKQTARKVQGGASLGDLLPMLEFVARGFAPAWLLMADLELELEGDSALPNCAEHVRRFLETSPNADDAHEAWQKLIGIYRSLNDSRGAANALLRLSEVSEPSLNQISQIANWLNNDRSVIDGVDVWERQTLLKPLATLLEQHISVATATDLSRLAWLHLHSGDNDRALQLAELGLEREPYNVFCERLVERLTKS